MMKRTAWLLVGILSSALLAAQRPPRPLVTDAIDESKLVTLAGTVHPLATAQNDRGRVADSFAAERVLLLLNRPPEREAALDDFMQDAHTPGSTRYHQWLTPEEFGRQFGPAESDIATASGWLASHGLRVARVSKGRQFIEFSGTAAQLREAFHTEIHQYGVHGGTHYANATAIRIPAALAPLIKGVSPLNDFRAQPEIKTVGRALFSRTARKTTPQWTLPNQYGTSNPYEFTVAPADYATQYDLNPLYAAGVNGAGQTIGIVNESNIDLSLARAFRSFFRIEGMDPQVVIDGDDPGTLPGNGVETEAYLDVEMSGAIAPKATVNLYIAGAENLVDPLALAALRAVEDNQAGVLSVSFGQCEFFLGNAGNQFWAELWEQAAAQGQTVLVSSGDNGSECFYDPNWVSGLASTPWNVAVGGTDFYYSDYATGGASAETLWNTTNNANLGSLKAPLLEQPWDDPFGLNLISDSFQRGEYYAGGGGKSSCARQLSSGFCAGGYGKPAWQAGRGVPGDRARDLPDVSLFASNGANLSAYPICAFEGECAAGSGDSAEVLLTGGTSASAPAMAGIMALVDQKYGRQGQANFTLYGLARQRPEVFHDIAVGSNRAPCGNALSFNCIRQPNGYNGTRFYTAGPGYDLATGWGSVDAKLLVDNWKAISFRPTVTTLRLSSADTVHGAPVTVSASVAPVSGAGVPQGTVAILTNSALPANQSEFYIPLSEGSGGDNVDFLPGGEYQVTARYGGDGQFAASSSRPVKITVAPEASNINFLLSSGSTAIGSGGSVAFNAPFQLGLQPTGASVAKGKSDGIATGSASFKIDSTSATAALNSDGFAAWQPPALAIGTHTASASYSGDASYRPSTAAPVTFTVTPGLVSMNINVSGPYTFMYTKTGEQLPWYYLNTGSTLTVGVTAQGWNTAGANPSQIPLGTPAPTGTVRVCLGTYPGPTLLCQKPYLAYSKTVNLTSLTGLNSDQSLAVATFPNLAAGGYYVTAIYNGDSHWQTRTLFYSREYVVEKLPKYAPTVTKLTITPRSFSGGQIATITAAVEGTGNRGQSPKGEIDFYDNDVFLTYTPLLQGVKGDVSTFSFEVNPAWFLKDGLNNLVAVYSGDQANGPSMSNVVNFTANQTVGEFSLAPQSPEITVRNDGSAGIELNLESLSNFHGAVTLACQPSSRQLECSVAPAKLTLNGAAVASVWLHAHAAPAGAYGLVVTGAGGGHVHNAKITVTVQP